MNNYNLMKYIYAFSTGDGGLYRNKGRKNAYFSADSALGHSDYINYRANILSEVTEVKVTNYVAKSGKTYVRTRSLSHPKYTIALNRLYATGRKGIDPHILKFIDWEYLAIWYMDDGSADSKGQARPIVKLATYGFTYHENIGIKFAIKEKLGIEFNLIRETVNGRICWFLKLPVKYYNDFKAGVYPFVVDSYMYKLPEPRQDYRTSKRLAPSDVD